MNKHRRALRWDGKAEAWPRNRNPFDRELNLVMLAQDVATEIWGHLHRDRRGRRRAEFRNCSAELERMLVESIPHNHYGKDLTTATATLLEMVAQELIHQGECCFEMRMGWNDAVSPPGAEAAALVWIPRESVYTLGRLALQVVPAGATQDTPRTRIKRLERRNLVIFAPPKEWRSQLSRIRALLPALGAREHEWMMSVAQQKSEEDFKEATRAYAEHRARLTAAIGWAGRGSFQSYISDYHWATRQLKWQRFCISVRDHLLDTLAVAFARIAATRNETPKVLWGDLPSARDVDWAQNRLAEGAPIDEILKPFKLGIA